MMQYTQLGRTGLKVSRLCLGTMTWGEQNSEAEAHAQLDRAIEWGVNFIDTAEMYPVPPRHETYGLTERYIGNWMKLRNNRERLVLATKVAGRAQWLPYIRGGHPCLDSAQVKAALDASLKRLQTDYIDLYQLHWPDRTTNFFGSLGYHHVADEVSVPIAETLEALHGLVTAGKVRYIGLSNETPWGVMTFLHLAERHGWPRVASIQNPYNLLNRTFEIGLAEIAHREDAGLLAYSPLAFGALTGKYLSGAQPKGARLTLYKRFSRYTNDVGRVATRAYVELARRHGLDPAQMALAYVNSRPFLTSTLIGATTMAQLETNLASAAIQLPEEVIAGIEAIHEAHPNPCP